MPCRTRGKCGLRGLMEAAKKSQPHQHPEVAPQVLHLRQVPLRISVELPHSAQLSLS